MFWCLPQNAAKQAAAAATQTIAAAQNAAASNKNTAAHQQLVQSCKVRISADSRGPSPGFCFLDYSIVFPFYSVVSWRCIGSNLTTLFIELCPTTAVSICHCIKACEYTITVSILYLCVCACVSVCIGSGGPHSTARPGSTWESGQTGGPQCTTHPHHRQSELLTGAKPTHSQSHFSFTSGTRPYKV